MAKKVYLSLIGNSNRNSIDQDIIPLTNKSCDFKTFKRDIYESEKSLPKLPGVNSQNLKY